MEQDKILEFAKIQGHDRVGIKTLWNGFDVYLLGNPLATPEETKDFFTFLVRQQRRPKSSKKKAKKK